MKEEKKIKPKRDRIAVILYVLYCLFLILSVVLVIKLIGIQLFFNPPIVFLHRKVVLLYKFYQFQKIFSGSVSCLFL